MGIHFGIIGCGKIAERHVQHIKNNGTLVAVCDINEKKVKAFGEKYNAQIYLTEIDLLTSHPEIDIVAICTPNGLHAPHTICALKKGFHVVCEKPMALTVTDCDEMINAAKTANKHLFIVKQNRFNPPVVAVKKIMDEGRLGKIFSIQLNCFWNRDNEYYHNSWKGTKDLDGGTLYTQFSHFIDLLYWLAGDIKNVHAFAANYNHKKIIEFEDAGVAVLEFMNGAIGTINYTVNSFEKNMEGSLTIFAEKGTVKIGGEYLNKLEYQSIQDYTIENLPEGNTANHYGNYSGSMSNHDKVYANVCNVLMHGETQSNSNWDALKTVEIINKIYAASKNITTGN